MSLSEGPDCVDAQLCRGDFYEMLEDAVGQCGGIPSNVLGGGRTQWSTGRCTKS